MLILVAYTVIVLIWVKIEEPYNDFIAIAILMFAAVCGHFFWLLVRSAQYYTEGDRAMGKYYLLTMIIVGIVGFSACNINPGAL